ncbi:general substrate transporter [Fusarium flagelliforme]|uniref:general substrate transporter n=1 Tax=Fusarium flagelliforme TaxID=2675880 RepID=UPI001E8E07B7|nr:general substrate transporter [Fusarium flagelliforme]KAH7175036.1 general substrate transporter [Fusarium flagelliforme]
MAHYDNEKGDAEKPDVHYNENAVVQVDRETSAWKCITANPKIVLWTLYANIGSAMVGYENLALSICLAMPAFQQTFASNVGGTLIIPAGWQSAWNAMYNVMQLVGAFTAGHLQGWFGRRSVFFATILCASAGIAISYISETQAQFLAGKIVSGFAVGLVLAGTQTYVSEIAPLPMRGIALGTNTVMLNLGMLIAVSATYSRVSIMDKSAFRVIFAAGWTFPGALSCGLLFLPESPYWLVMKNKHEEARRALERLSAPGEDIDARLTQIQHIIENERKVSSNKASLIECFRGTNMRRTRILLICMYMPKVVGAVLSNNAPYFLNQTGLDSHKVVMFTQIGVGMGAISAVVNLFMMMKIRQRLLMFIGVGIAIIMYLIMGIASLLPKTITSLTIIGMSLQFISISYGPAVGASMAVAGEVSASKLRAQSLGLGAAFMAVASTIWQVILPYLFNQDQADLGGKLGWIFFAMAVIYLVIVYFDVPGTRGRTYAELDDMFEKRVAARRFDSYKFEDTEGLE